MERNKFEATKLWSAIFILLNLINILTNLGFSMITTTISVYTVSLGASLSVAGTVASVFSFAALLIRPISGLFFDKGNKRIVFVVSTVLFGAVVYGYAFAKSIPMLFALRILHGVLFSISSTTTMALASRFIPSKRIGEGLGYFNAGMMIGQAIGPSIGVAIKDAIGFSGLYTIVATFTCFLPLALLLVKMPQEVLAPNRAPKSAEKVKYRFNINDFFAKQFLLYALICGVFSFYNGVTNAFMLLIGEARGIENISLFFTVSSAVLLAVRIFVGKISDQKSLTALVNYALAFTIISMFSAGIANSLLLVIVAAVLKALGQGIGQISLQGEALKRAEIARVGVATSTMYIGNDIGNTLGPIVGGVVSQWSSYKDVFTVSIGIVVVAIIAFNIYQRKIGYRKGIEEAGA